MITILSDELVDEHVIAGIFKKVLEITLKAYQKIGDYDLEPMGSQQDMDKNLSKIAGCIVRACKTYYDTPEEQLVQIISSITINHYLENGNKRTAVSAGILYLISYETMHSGYSTDWLIDKINHLKFLADSFATSGNDFENVKQQMIKYTKQNIFS